MFPAPPMPVFPAGQSTVATGFLRWEDVTQDGRLLPIAIPPSLGYLWRDILNQHPGQRNAMKAGLIPILSRLTLVASEQAIRLDREVEMRAGFEIARDAAGERVFMNVWSEIHGTAGRLSRAATAGERALAGSLFAEHTFTRLLAPPDQRRVKTLDVDGYPNIPESIYGAPAPVTAQDPPDGASWLDELAPDATEHAFTIDQTDSNQHVNSLVYIRMFLDAVNRRLATLGRPLKLRSRAVDIAYRKPSFAGDRVRAHLRLFESAGAPGASGFVAGDDGKPRCYVRALLAQ
jgi:hypothetical protein